MNVYRVIEYEAGKKLRVLYEGDNLKQATAEKLHAANRLPIYRRSEFRIIALY